MHLNNKNKICLITFGVRMYVYINVTIIETRAPQVGVSMYSYAISVYRFILSSPKVTLTPNSIEFILS